MYIIFSTHNKENGKLSTASIDSSLDETQNHSFAASEHKCCLKYYYMNLFPHALDNTNLDEMHANQNGLMLLLKLIPACIGQNDFLNRGTHRVHPHTISKMNTKQRTEQAKAFFQ